MYRSPCQRTALKECKMAARTQIYQIRVTLQGFRPPIWRRIQVRSSTRLDRLHEVIQVAMGWTNAHLHQFIVGDTYYGMRAFFPDDPEVNDETAFSLGRITRTEGAGFLYEYDFGDSWQHELLVEGITEPEQGVRYPVCIAGERACPPEDVGGIWGYETFLEAMADPGHPEHEDYVEWIGGVFDPDAFDLAEVNAMLRRLR
jgi:hypothetical protein